ncbi:integrase family protein [Methanobacterium lacus]|uniref:Integrase family protein n=1 Tax=Methanobacterium lacus (strain AL-21) TaxID=877455 RepID=F0TCB2_METLA|nr:tyrosine-type recombinase/integrase [Methanobacterium lacus]ADZ10379.1 integrase family protein [Methanobacterium lacus]
MNSELIEKWFIKKDLSESTQSLYRLGLKKYCELIGKSPDELLEEAEREEDEGLRLRKRKIDYYLPKYKKHLEEAGNSPQTIKVYLSAVKSFYKTNQIEIPEVSNKVTDICLEKNEGRLLTRDDIQKMIETSPIREKTIIYLMALTGMSQAEVRNLTIQKFLNTVNESVDKKIETIDDLFENEKLLNDVVLIIEITRQKVHYRYQTFIPPEVTRNIVLYLKDRVYGRNDNVRIIDCNKTLFVSNKGEKLTKQGIASNFNRIGKKAGFTANEKGAYGFWRSHGLRKYFISTIINNTGDHILADYLVGHKISPIKRAYWKADPEKLKEKYLEVLPYLSIDEIKVKDFKTKEYKELKEKNKALQAQVDKINKNMEENMKTINLWKEVLPKKFQNLNKDDGKNGNDTVLAKYKIDYQDKKE